MGVFITGVSSSLGLKVAELGKKRGFKISGSVRSTRLSSFRSEFVDNLVSLDLEDPSSFLNLKGEVDTIVHVAALSYGSPLELMLVTGLGTFNLVERAKALGVRSLIHVSAVSVYGHSPTGLLGASSPVSHSTPYGAAKWAAECYLNASQSVINCISIRCPAILEREYSPHLLGRIINKIKMDSPIKLTNPEFMFNNFVTLDSLAEFITNLIENVTNGYVAFPIGSKDPLAFSEVVALLAREFDSKSQIDWVNSETSPFSIDNTTAISYGFQPLPVLEGLRWWLGSLRD